MLIVGTVRSFFAELEAVGGDRWQDITNLPLVVGVSGGPDSVTLLHVLTRRGVWSPEQITVAHLDHLLRPESASDASFVQSLAQDWQLQFRTNSVDVKELAKQKRLSIETAAREARYAFLADVAREVGANFIAIGHNQNDQAETVLMHIVRGSGLTGLRGMRPVSPAPAAPDLSIIRPLLSVSRDSIEAYCRQNGLRYVEDESNEDVSMLRNRLRHELLPALEDLNPRIVHALSSLAGTVEADEDLLSEIFHKTWSSLVTEVHKNRVSLALGQWRASPLAIRRRSIKYGFLLLRPDSSEIGFEAIELARRVAEKGQVGDRAMLPGEVLMTLEYDQLVLEAPQHRAPTDEWPQLKVNAPLSLPVPGQLRLGESWVIRAKRIPVSDFEVIANNSDPWCAYIRPDLANGLILRTRRPGDRLRPLGMRGRSAKIGDIMTNRKIPAGWRERWPILANRDHPLWLVGHTLDDRASVQPYAQEVLRVRVERLVSVDER